MTGVRASTASALAKLAAQSGHIDELVIDRGILDQAPAVLARTLAPQAVLVVADDNTFGAAGERVKAAFESSGVAVETVVFPGSPRLKPDIEVGRLLAARIGATQALPVAVGSGVINDLTKYASFLNGRRYASIPTAASMDGYAAPGAPLIEKGFKHSVPCRGPRVVVADLDVIAAAPRAMSAWGYCDLAAKIPAGADWILADALGVEPIDRPVWNMVQGDLRSWLARPAEIARGEPDAFGGLIAGLLAGGFAMLAYGSSRPASGADHQIGHLWEMEDLSFAGEPVSHGICVGLASIAVLELYGWLLGRDLSGIDVERLVAGRPSRSDRESAVLMAFPPGMVRDRSRDETLAKHDHERDFRDRLQRVSHGWPQIRDALSAHLTPAAEFAARIEAVGGKVAPEEVGMDPDHYRQSILRARFIRRRYTILDLLEELGLLETAVDELF